MSYYKNHNFNIETHDWKFIKSDKCQSASVNCSNSETRQRLFNEKYIYKRTTESTGTLPSALPTVQITINDSLWKAGLLT